LGPKGNTIGHVHVGIYPAYIDDIIVSSNLRNFGLTAVCLILGVILTLIVMTALLRPIGDLKRGMARIGKGELDTRIETKNRTDLGLLAEAVNDMAGKLQESQSTMLERDLALTEAHEQMQIHVSELQTQILERIKAEEALRVSEEKLMQSQKMEAIGQLAGGVAHDFNNILTSINGFASLILRKAGGNDKLHHYGSEIGKSCGRAADLIKKLLAFSRKQVLAPKIVNLNQVISDMSAMLQPLLGRRIDLEFRADPDLRNTRADPGQMEQVIMNLVVNARDAMPEGGKITVETLNSKSDEGEGRTGAGSVVIRVSDTGTGMDGETMKRIFEPFYTTKERDKGTGLGLSTVYGIVKQTGGDISVASEIGRGTTFTIVFPCLDENAPEEPVATLAAPVRDKNETVLVVDDEVQVLEMVSTLLMKSGYDVITAANGKEAVDLVSGTDAAPDLLLTDVMMPELNGVEAYQKISQELPGIKVVFMSGYTGGAYLTQDVAHPTDLLQKPFQPEELLERVRQALDSRRAA
jgi:signal transduction histidine kinase/CheY-like chemotaxis protein